MNILIPVISRIKNIEFTKESLLFNINILASSFDYVNEV